MNYIVDIIFIAIILVIVVASAKKGFTATLLDACSVLIAGFATYKLTKPVAEFIYDLCVRDLVMTNFKHTLDKMSSSISIQEKITGLIDSLPKTAVKFADGIGVNISSLKSSIVQSAANTDEKLIEMVTDNIAYNIMIVITEVITAIILFILSSILISLIAKLFTDLVKKIPLIGTADTALGAVLGFVKAAVIIFVVSTLFCFIVKSADSDSPLKVVEDSKIYNFINERNPIIEILDK